MKRDLNPNHFRKWLRIHNRLVKKYGIIGNPKAEKLLTKIQDLLENILDQ